MAAGLPPRLIRALGEETAFEVSEGQQLTVSALTTDLNKDASPLLPTVPNIQDAFMPEQREKYQVGGVK